MIYLSSLLILFPPPLEDGLHTPPPASPTLFETAFKKKKKKGSETRIDLFDRKHTPSYRPRMARRALLTDCYGEPHYSAGGFNLNYMENIW